MVLFHPRQSTYGRFDHFAQFGSVYSLHYMSVSDLAFRVSTLSTPLTHQRFLRRYRGSYGPAIRAGEASFPFPNTPIEGLLVCGDSCFPGIGVPAVAGSGFLAANSVSFASIGPQLKLLESMRSR